MAKAAEALKAIYNERNDFIVIGLTGRTGSGCTEASTILQTDGFENLRIRQPKENGFTDTDERKHRVLYHYAKEHWKDGFQSIEMSSIISLLLFKEGYERLRDFLSNLSELNNNETFFNDLEGCKSSIDKLQKMINEVWSKKYYGLDREKSSETIELLKEVKATHLQLKKVAGKHRTTNNEQLYTFLFQTFGNNIRSTGNPFKDEFSGKHMFSLAKITNDYIKALRKENEKAGKPTHICIDAIRNPYEATYLKDRYSAFYLVSINTEDRVRKARLGKKLDEKEIEKLDKREYPEQFQQEELRFYNQNIRACLEMTDIHIFNPDEEVGYFYFLTEQLLKYFVLMIHPGLLTPTRIERCMQVAYNAKLNSGCLSRQVGAVITNSGYYIKAIGWNDVPAGQVPCNLRDVRSFCINKDDNSHSHFEITNSDFNLAIEKKYKMIKYKLLLGRLHPYCFKDIYNKDIKPNEKNQVHTRALHAEENAFLQITKFGGGGIEGGCLFTTSSPCELCSKKAYHLGIKHIYYIDPYPGISIDHILNFGPDNKQNPQMHLFYGAIGSAYTNLYSQRLPVKDELNILTEVD